MSLSRDASEIKKMVEAKPVFKAAAPEDVASRRKVLKRFKISAYETTIYSGEVYAVDEVEARELANDMACNGELTEEQGSGVFEIDDIREVK